MRNTITFGLWLFLGALSVVVVANLLHRVVFPETPPDPATFPQAGDTFGSMAEGFVQHVEAVEDGWLVLRTHIAPRAPGPPQHVHRTFAETFRVERGRLDIQLPEGVKRLGPGEEFRIAPGTPHRPFNATDEEVIVASHGPAMPQSFGACLVQIYHFLDAAKGEMGIGLGLRISALEGICDAAPPDVPRVAQVAMQWLVLPFARAAGYRNYYPELSLHPGEAAEARLHRTSTKD